MSLAEEFIKEFKHRMVSKSRANRIGQRVDGEVFCKFIKADGSYYNKWLPVQDMKWHILELKDSLGKVTDEVLVIDSGIIKENQRAYLAKGIPPLVYKESSVLEVRDI